MDRAPETQVMCVNVEKWDKPCVNVLKPIFRPVWLPEKSMFGIRLVATNLILFCLVLENKKILSEMTLVIFSKVIFIC